MSTTSTSSAKASNQPSSSPIIPSHKNNYLLPLDSPTSPHPDETVTAVASIYHRVIMANQSYLMQNPRPSVPLSQLRGTAKLLAVFDYQVDLTTENGEVTREGLRKYILNFAYRTRLRNEILIAALVFIDRLVEMTQVVITVQNHLLILTYSLILSQKLFDDYHYKLSDYAQVTKSIPKEKLVKAEHAFLKLVKYDLIIKEKDYNRYRSYITTRFAGANLREAFPDSPLSVSIRNGCEGMQSIRGIGEFLKRQEETLGGRRESVE